MKKLVLALASVAALAGCMQPAVTGASSDTVIIRHDRVLQDADDLKPQADAECRRHGKVAKFRNYTDESIGVRLANFDCVAAG